MPELPEVETTIRGIKPHIIKQTITSVIIRHFGLRWPIDCNIKEILTGLKVEDVARRAKYILLKTINGTLILHLGMSGSIRILPSQTPPQKHDHIDIEFSNQLSLRFRDPRRFGACIWTTDDPLLHSLLRHLGPEPLSEDFSGAYLWQVARKRKVPVKSFIMDSKVVVGVGNIYAAEALFSAGISPLKPAGKVSLVRYQTLVLAIQTILRSAIEQGGTTLKDFLNTEGKRGYFSVKLKVYGRGGQPCLQCKSTLKEIRLGQRSTVYCPKCQK